MGCVNVGEGSRHSVGGEARVVSLRSSVWVVASTSLNTEIYMIVFVLEQVKQQKILISIRYSACDQDLIIHQINLLILCTYRVSQNKLKSLKVAK